MKRLLVSIMLALLPVALLSACVTLHQGGGTPVSLHENWALLPFVNNTETPYAAERAEAVTAALLYARGVRQLERYTVETKVDEMGVDRGERRQREALELAKQKKVRYALVGTVNEWRYKVGLDGEPVVSIALQVIQLPDGKVVWSGSAGKSGWSRDAVSAVAQQVLDRLLGTINVADAAK